MKLLRWSFFNCFEGTVYFIEYSRNQNALDRTTIFNGFSKIKYLYHRHWSSSYGSGAYDFERARPFPSIHRRDAHGIRNIWNTPYDKTIVNSRLSSQHLDLRDRKDIYIYIIIKECFSFNLLDYLIPLRNANISSSRSHSAFFPGSHCYLQLAHVVFFETVACIVAVDVAQSSVLDCEFAPA